jgi:hypothetical protein
MNTLDFNGAAFDGTGTPTLTAPALVLVPALASILLAPDTDPFAVDARRATLLAADTSPWGVDGTKAASIAPDTDPFAVDPWWTTPIPY